MNQVKVYHLTTNDRELRLYIDFTRGDKLLELVKANLDQYTHVASPISYEVKLGEILNDSFRMTNSIDYAWFEDMNSYPTEKAAQGCRSTSVGDIVEFAGVKYLVDSYGFSAID